MQLTRYTDYSLRVLVYLALQQDERRVTINEVVERFDMPRNHLIKVVQQLGHLGYIDTLRGKHGGLRLARSPSAIRISEVVASVEANLELINCTTPHCPVVPGCHLKGILDEAMEAFFAVLACYSLADLVSEPQQLQRLLHVAN